MPKLDVLGRNVGALAEQADVVSSIDFVGRKDEGGETIIQVDWALYGPKLAQVALTFGADDLDSVAAAEDESKGQRRTTPEEIRRAIQAASMTPVERNGRF